MIQYSLYRRLGRPHGRFERVRKMSHPPVFDPRTPQPVASRYVDYAFPVHKKSRNNYVIVHTVACLAIQVASKAHVSDNAMWHLDQQGSFHLPPSSLKPQKQHVLNVGIIHKNGPMARLNNRQKWQTCYLISNISTVIIHTKARETQMTLLTNNTEIEQ